MYLAWTLIYLGVAPVINAAWLLILLPLLLLLVHRDALREERHLEERFGSAYRRTGAPFAATCRPCQPVSLSYWHTFTPDAVD
jgi:hypothetical protein